MKSSKIRKSARGQECTARIFPHCNFDPETTVLAHINSHTKGMGKKSNDYFSLFACSTCHDIIDGRMKVDLSSEEIKDCIMRGLSLTWEIWLNNGLLKVG